MSNLIEYAKEELKRVGSEKSIYGDALTDAVLELVKVFSDQNHSGMSASVVVGLFSKLAKFEPITPLTGEDDEWIKHTDGTWQNRRCFHVFKDTKTGKAYDDNGKVFIDSEGLSFTNGDSRVEIIFPYIPKTEFIKVKKNV